MKTNIKTLIFGLVMASFIYGCSSLTNKKSVDISKNEALRDTVYKQILNNSDLFNDFMTKMMESHQAMNWMMNNQGMMQSMFSNDNLKYILQHHSGVSYGMMENMMNVIHNDTALSNRWQYMMKNNPSVGHMMMHR